MDHRQDTSSGCSRQCHRKLSSGSPAHRAFFTARYHGCYGTVVITASATAGAHDHSVVLALGLHHYRGACAATRTPLRPRRIMVCPKFCVTGSQARSLSRSHSSSFIDRRFTASAPKRHYDRIRSALQKGRQQGPNIAISLTLTISPLTLSPRSITLLQSHLQSHEGS